MNLSELRSKTSEELKSELSAVLKELFNLRVQKGVGQNPQAHLFKKSRRLIAQIKTILREKEKGS